MGAFLTGISLVDPSARFTTNSLAVLVWPVITHVCTGTKKYAWLFKGSEDCMSTMMLTFRSIVDPEEPAASTNDAPKFDEAAEAAAELLSFVY